MNIVEIYYRITQKGLDKMFVSIFYANTTDEDVK